MLTKRIMVHKTAPSLEAVVRTCIELGGTPMILGPRCPYLEFVDVPVRALRHRLARYGNYRLRSPHPMSSWYRVIAEDPEACATVTTSRAHMARTLSWVRQWVREYITRHEVELSFDYAPDCVPVKIFNHTVRRIAFMLLEAQGKKDCDSHLDYGMTLLSSFEVTAAFSREFGVWWSGWS